MNKLCVKNFGPVKEAEVELKKINLIIGEQSIGKSTLAKLITIMTDYYNLSTIVLGGLKGWRAQLTQYGLDNYVSGDYRVECTLEEKECTIHILVLPSGVTSTLKKEGKTVTNNKAIVKELLALKPVFHKNIFLEQLEEARVQVDKREKDSDILSLIFLMNNSIYIPAERIIYSLFNKLQSAIALAKDAVPIQFLRFMLEVVKAQSKYSHFDSDLLNITYIKDNSDDFIIDQRCNKRLPLFAASSGIQSTIPLLLVLENVIHNSEYSSIVIEEPETNLFPQKQVELVKYIIGKVKENNRTLTITTHSPYLLSVMNNLLYAGSIANEFGSRAEKPLDKIISNTLHLDQSECSVYSLSGESGSNEYCASLIDEETGLIDVNSLDSISTEMAREFGELEDIYIELSR